VTAVELYGTSTCPYTRDAREWLELGGREFVEYDIDADPAARERWRNLPNAGGMVPVMVEGGIVTRSGWQGRGCAIVD
jgi:glutaredoxin 3